MPSYDHKRLIDRIARLGTLPKDAAKYADWIKADKHIRFLEKNANDDELVIFALGDYTFIHTVVVTEGSLSPPDQEDLLRWSGNPYSSRAGYAWGGKRNDVWIERGSPIRGSDTLKGAELLVFAREIEGLKGDGRAYFEILQEYSHLSEIHWRSEQRAYCRFNEHGDWEQVVSVTTRETQRGVTLVSFKRADLEQYLAASNSLLVRTFDFTLLRRSEFTDWPDGPENVVRESDNLFYRQKVDAGKAAYTRGVQILRPTRPRNQILSSIKGESTGGADGQYCDFIAQDWRNKRVVNISTHPSATTNYFDASNNSLPYEVSPAFFRSEVLSKYKADRDKYTISEEHRFISCRGGWELKTYDVNEAGQTHTYICYLRDLPHQEQLYWRSFNEEPKAAISERAFLNDFKGEWVQITKPLEVILSIMRRWYESDVPWWTLRDETLLEHTNAPHTASRDEWAQAFSDLVKLVIEDFETNAIRARLREMGIEFGKDEKSLTLIEKVLIRRHAIASGAGLGGLRIVQGIRSKVASHSGGSGAVQLEREALEEHGTYSAHFESICNTVTNELTLIEGAFS